MGKFFRDLGVQEGLDELSIPNGTEAQDREQAVSACDMEALVESIKSVHCPFGPYLKHIRVAMKVSQKRIAEFAQYQLRNILVVENGTQEPGVNTALSLVYATGYDVGLFFSGLKELVEKTCKVQT